MTRTRQPEASIRASWLLMVGAVGVVFGDIGTSPIYTVSVLLDRGAPTGRVLRPELVYGMASSIIWTLVLVVSVLYVRNLLRADNEGEGGLLALLGLLRQRITRPRTASLLTLIALLGASVFLGDSVITPAISVLSAAEGLGVVDPGLKSAEIPLALTVLAVLFLVQRIGTAWIGRLFGPIMLLWFTTLTLMGAWSIVQHASVLLALSPHWIVLWFAAEPGLAFLSLGAVVLAVTGAEALYTDLGHFGRRAIARSWTFIVLPALVINYLGQTAIVLRDPSTAHAPFFSLMPAQGRLALVVVATAATIIASQAVISGTFTVVQQASRLGLLPRLRVTHTSATMAGQIYVPLANWLLGTGVMVLVVGFGSSAALASAYGLAVTVTITVTTLMFLFLNLANHGGHGQRAVVVFVLAVMVLFLAANLPKLTTGGWLPVSIGITLFTIMSTWVAGRRRSRVTQAAHEIPLMTLLESVNAPGSGVRRVPGSAVYFARQPRGAPTALSLMIDSNQALHQTVVLLTLHTVDRPFVPRDEQVTVDNLSNLHDGVCQVTALVGFAEHPDLRGILLRAIDLGHSELDGLDIESALFFVSHSLVVLNPHSPMMRWRQRLFLVLDRLSPDVVEVFGLPAERTLVVGREVSL